MPMQYTVKELPQNSIEFTITVDPADISHELAHAAEELSAARPIAGFRPGKATFDMVKAHFGEMAIYERALGEIVRVAFNEALEKEKVQPYGQPQVSVKTLVPGSPIVFTAEVVKIPRATSLPELSSITVSAKEVTVGDTEVQQTLGELAKMQTREEKVDRAAEAADKVVVDMDLSLDGVAVEGGQARNHGILLGEEYYIPGVKDQLIGLKPGDKKTFTLPFPENHYQKQLAGKNVEFAVTLKEVAALTTPAIDDAFASALGQPDLATLSSLLKKNLEEESQKRENERQEIEMLQSIIAKASFEPIPDVIVNAEVSRMVHELQHDVEARGMDFAKYLESVGKTMDQIKLDFASKAIERIQVAMVINTYAEQLAVEVSDEEMLSEITRLLNEHTDPASQERIRSTEYQDYLRTTLRNRRVIQLIKEKVQKSK